MTTSVSYDGGAGRATPAPPGSLWGEAVARRSGSICAALLFVMFVNLVTVVGRKSITNDETVLIPAAYYHYVNPDLRLVNEHPPLAKLLAGLPLVLMRPRRVWGAPPPERHWESVMARFWNDNRAEFGRICFWARVPACVLAVALGALVFLFARDLFGPRAAVLAVALYTLEPTVLAHGRIVQTDVPAAFGCLLLLYALRRYAREPSRRRALALGGAAGIALIAKFSLLLAAPALASAFLWLLWRAPREGRRRSVVAVEVGLAVLAALIVVHASYSFHLRALSAADARWVVASFPAHAQSATRAARALSLVLPTDYVLGALWQVRHNAEGHDASLLGMYGRTGWWYYFSVAFALKTTLPFLLLSAAALAWSCRELCARRDLRHLWLLAPFALYTALVMASRINIGVRYYLPAYVPLFVLGGALLERLVGSRRARRAGLAAAVVLMGWIAVEAARAYPDYVPYMNQLAAGRPHWQLLSDSNVEWGDDTFGLIKYLRDRGETRVRGALLGGFLTPRCYDGVAYTDILEEGEIRQQPTRFVALGASFLNGSTVPNVMRGRRLAEEERINYFDAYRRRAPEAIIGGSIYVFREPE